MSASRLGFAVLLSALVLAGCAKPQPRQILEPALPDHGVVVRAYVAPPESQPAAAPAMPQAKLAGRTLSVASAADIVLRPGEVVLTFDDGPRPGKTEKILDTLDSYGIKATFLMLGEAAQRHPELVRQVALRGHNVGSHTQTHANLTTLARGAANDEIRQGQRSVAEALAPSGLVPGPFFRFPYLSQTRVMRAGLEQNAIVIMDVDIDSKDYYKVTPKEVAARTLALVDRQRSGIVLFHDIHQRTIEALPLVLAGLHERGIEVVHLRPTRRDSELTYAALD